MNSTRYARLTEGNRVEFAPRNATQTELTEGGYLPYVVLEKPTGDHNYAVSNVQKDGRIYRDWQAYPNFERIKELKKQLEATDYKVIKCSEAQLAGVAMPYDLGTLHAERQTVRDEINRLERCEDNE